MINSRRKHARRIAMGGALGLAVLVAFAPNCARAQDDDDDNSNKTSIWNFDQRFLGAVMRGLGFRSANEKPIEYRERSPLVIPPSRDLPPPQQTGAGRTPAWPSDPDVRRKQAAAEKRKQTNYRGYDPDFEGRNLTPSELNPPGVTGSTGAGSKAGAPPNMGDDGKPMRPSELGYFGGLFSSFGKSKEEFATFDREPPRNNLTAPPAGYQTPSPAQPYGLSDKKDKATVTPYDPAVGN